MQDVPRKAEKAHQQIHSELEQLEADQKTCILKKMQANLLSYFVTLIIRNNGRAMQVTNKFYVIW